MIVDPFSLRDWAGGEMVFIHFCSGAQRSGDLVSCVERLAHDQGLQVLGIRVDPLNKTSQKFIGGCNDLLNNDDGISLLRLVQSGRVLGCFVSPPCSTFSAARHRPVTKKQHGPRPLRSRSQAWVCLPDRNPKEQTAVMIGSALALICIGLCGEVRCYGGWSGFEHPADRGHEPYPSVFATLEMKALQLQFGLRYYQVDQCMYGAPSQKPTGLVLPHGNNSLIRRCNHWHGHLLSLGWDPALGVYTTTDAAKYPEGFSMSIATCFVTSVLKARGHGYTRPFAPKKRSLADDGFDPWCSPLRTAWEWAEPHRGFLTQCIAQCNKRKIPACNESPQS